MARLKNNEKCIDEGLKCYKESYKIKEKLGLGERRECAEALHHIGNFYDLKGDHKKAMGKYEKAIDILE